MIQALLAIDQLFERICKLLVQVAVAVQTLVIAAQVISRYFLSSPLVWAEELARYLLVMITFFGGAIAFKNLQLASIDSLTSKLPTTARKLVVLVGQLAILSMLVVVTYYGARLMLSPSAMKQRSPAMQMPIYYVYAIIPSAGLMMIFHQFVHIYKNMTGTLKAGERITE